MPDEAKLRKVALLTVPVCGAFLCLFLLAAALWLFQGREFWATASRTVATVGTDVSTAVQPIAPLVTSGQKAVDGLTGAVGEAKGLVADARPVLRHLTTTEGKLDAAIDHADGLIANTDGNLNRVCPTPAQVAAGQKVCGTLADIAKTLGAGRVVMERTGHVVDKFDQHEDALFAQETDFYAGWKPIQASAVKIMGQGEGISTSLNSILARGYLVEEKATQCYLYPTFKCTVHGLLVPAVQIGGAAYTAFK